MDDAATKLSDDARWWIKNMGSKQIFNLDYRQSFAFICVIGKRDKVIEKRGKSTKE